MQFLRHIMRNEALGNLTPTGHINAKRDRRKQRITYLTSSCKDRRLGEIQNLLTYTTDMKTHKTTKKNRLTATAE